MKNFKFYKFIAFFYASIFDRVRQGTEFEMAVNATLDDYWTFPENENILKNLTLSIHYLNVKYALNKSFTQKQIEVYKNQLELIKDSDLTKWLNSEELEYLNETINDLNAYIDAFLLKS